MKKFLFCLMAAVATIGMTSCDKGDNKDNEPNDPTPTNDSIVGFEIYFDMTADSLAYEYIKVDLEYFGNADTADTSYLQLPEGMLKKVTFNNQLSWTSPETYSNPCQVAGYRYTVTLDKSKLDTAALRTMSPTQLAGYMTTHYAELQKIFDEKDGLYINIRLMERWKYASGKTSEDWLSTWGVDLRGKKLSATDLNYGLSLIEHELSSHSYAIRTNNNTTRENIQELNYFWANVSE